MKKRVKLLIFCCLLFAFTPLLFQCRNEEKPETNPQDELIEIMKGVEEAVKKMDTMNIPSTKNETIEKKKDTIKERKILLE